MIGVCSEINITGISPHLEIESLVSVGRCWTISRLHWNVVYGTIIHMCDCYVYCTMCS